MPLVIGKLGMAIMPCMPYFKLNKRWLADASDPSRSDRLPQAATRPRAGRLRFTTQWLIGRIYKVKMAEGRAWRWSITSAFMQGMPSSGHSGTLEEARREFAAAWRAWLAKTGRDEETYRPLYGRPVDSMGTGRSD
jgi:hypothetical protein